MKSHAYSKTRKGLTQIVHAPVERDITGRDNMMDELGWTRRKDLDINAE